MPSFARHSRLLVVGLLVFFVVAVVAAYLGLRGPAPEALRQEFEAAVIEDSKQTTNWGASSSIRSPQGRRSSICSFGAKYGDEPLFLYRQFVHDYCGSVKTGDNGLARAALEALRCSRSQAGASLAEQVFRDSRFGACRLSALDAWIMLSGEPVGEVLGRLLLDEGASPYRQYILAQIQFAGDLAALPYLDEAARKPKSVSEGDLIVQVKALLSNPAACVLVTKWYAGDAGWQGWQCEYGCAGRIPSILVRLGELECGQVVANPNHADAG